MRQSNVKSSTANQYLPATIDLSPDNKKVLSSLFSKQFLGNVKNQLTQKITPKALIKKTVSNLSEKDNHQAQIQQFKKTINQLTLQNQRLKQQIEQLEAAQNSVNSNSCFDRISSLSTIDISKLKVSSKIVDLSLATNSTSFDENTKLKEKIDHLQILRTVKDQRITELLAKQAIYEGQIRLLKTKGQNLQEQVKSLRQSIKIQMSCIDQKPLRITNNSDVDIKMPSVFDQPTGSQASVQTQLLEKLGNFLQLQRQDQLLNSCCKDIQIPTQMHLSKLQMRIQKEPQLNEIDELIQQQLPFVQCSGDLQQRDQKVNLMLRKKFSAVEIANSTIYMNENAVAENINDSFVQIDINQPLKLQVEDNVNQSVVAINL